MAFDCIGIDFHNSKNNIDIIKQKFSYVEIVPFIKSYFDMLKAFIVNSKTEYIWIVSSLIDCSKFNFNFIPEQFEKDQIHVWYSGDNKEGNVFLIPKKQFINQMFNLKFLRDYKDINYRKTQDIINSDIPTIFFDLNDLVESYNSSEKSFYNWLVNKDIKDVQLPNYLPSMWEDVKLYTFGKTKDVMLVPYRRNIEQFYNFDRITNLPLDYKVKEMDVIFISYDEPVAIKRFNKLKEKCSRAKWVKNIKGQTKAYHTAAKLSETDYFFAVFPKIEIVDSFNFDYQPDRLKNACHYIFDCKNTVIDVTYGHDGVILYNKKLVLDTKEHGLDFTLSAKHDVVPILSAINSLNDTPLLAWRTAFREVIKLCHQPPTVESKFRLKKWLKLGKGKNAEWVFKGANDAKKYFADSIYDVDKLMLSYDFDWIKNYFEKKYEIRI